MTPVVVETGYGHRSPSTGVAELAALARGSVGPLRDLGPGRTRRPRRGSVSKLAGMLGLDAVRPQAFVPGRWELGLMVLG